MSTNIKHYYQPEKAVLNFVRMPLGKTADSLDIDKFAESILGVLDMGTRGTAIYNKVTAGELTPTELGQLLIECDRNNS